jgi:hypothetical protein
MDTLTVALAALASLVAAGFALVTADRWHRRRLTHHGAWTIAMVLFAVGSFSLWWATATGWSSGVFRVFFTAGAVLNVSWLALGSIALLAGDRVALPLTRVIALLSAFAIGVMAVAPTKKDFVASEFPQARDHFGVLPRVLAAVGSGLPALIIILGALWSIVRLVSRRSPAFAGAKRELMVSTNRLVASNVLIAIGTLVLSASGSLAGRLGEEQAFTVTLSVGVVILFVGFMVPSVRHGSRALAQGAAQHLAGATDR